MGKQMDQDKLKALAAELAKDIKLHIPADHEHRFRFNVNTISGPM
ncbi:hypothetical protein ACET9O_21190 [Aeromonas caviae]